MTEAEVRDLAAKVESDDVEVGVVSVRSVWKCLIDGQIYEGDRCGLGGWHQPVTITTVQLMEPRKLVNSEA